MNKNEFIVQEQIFTDGTDYFQALLTDIHHAKKSIDLEIYKFNKDSLGKKIAKSLIEAAKRNVKIRVIVDGAGSPEWGGSVTRQLEKNNIETRIFHPLRWGFWQWQRGIPPKPWIIRAFHLLTRINSRAHRKFCIIDNRIVYVGSFNICINHLSHSEGGDGWRDTGVKLTDVDCTNLKNAFEATWEHKHLHEPMRDIFRHIKTNPRFRLNYTWFRRRILYKNLLRRIKDSQRRIWITNAYFVPDSHLLSHLRNAAERGIDVRILLPHKSDVFIMPWASTTFYENLLKTGVRIFEYQPSMLHAKSLIIDDWMMVGSSNLNHRSILHDLEVDILILEGHAKNQLEHQFLNDLQHATEIQLEQWRRQRPWYRRLIGRLVLSIKYWI